MKQLAGYSLFLFDFDGLLVNTEELQFKAYQLMCAEYNLIMPWDFSTYCQFAHQSTEIFRTELFKALPALKTKESNWQILYPKKFNLYTQLLKTQNVELMPGAEKLLSLLQEKQIKHAVVTHSSFEHFNFICAQHPVLQKIPYKITRSDYKNPKPDPECYQLAVSRFTNNGEQVIGFEDSPRGLRALMGSCAKPVLITSYRYPEMDQLRNAGVEIYSNLSQAYNTLTMNSP